MYLDSNNYSSKSELLDAIEKEQNYINSKIEIENQKGKTILENSNIILMNILSTHVAEGNELLAKVNEMLDRTKNNIKLLTELKEALGHIRVQDIISENKDLIYEYNKINEKNTEEILGNTVELENFNTEVSTYIKRIVYDKANIIKIEDIKKTTQKEVVEDKIKQVETQEEQKIAKNKDEQSKSENVDSDLDKQEAENENNTKLIISEKNGKVYLPYKIEEVEKKFSKSKKYKTIEELIEAEYVLDLDIFKNAIRARFKQGFKLIKNKEKGSFVSAVKLGTELMFNYNLNPAIIAACKTENELDKYLDCLEERKLEKFEVFDVEFDVAPSTK